MNVQKDYYSGYDVNTFFSLANLQHQITKGFVDADLLDAAVFWFTNVERRKHNLKQFHFHAKLRQAAILHSEQMKRHNFFDHDNQFDTKYRTQTDRINSVKDNTFHGFMSWGENISDYPIIEANKSFTVQHINGVQRFFSMSGAEILPYSYYDFARIVVDGWMNSPDHRANILNPDFEYLGCGCEKYEEQGSGHTMLKFKLTQNFGGRLVAGSFLLGVEKIIDKGTKLIDEFINQKNMAQLKKGEKIKLQSGGNVTVLESLGEGGQGYVYKVKHDSGKDYALKWYKSPTDWMYKNISKLIAKGAPSNDFLWPQMLTRKYGDYFGYVMELRSPDYKDIMKSRKIIDFNQFSNPVLTRITVAMKICDALKRLHADGYVFYDLNDGGFFINPANGKVLICDCDNVSPLGESNMGGMMRFKAPEIVEGKSQANKQTDYFSLSVILFLLLYANHPFEGAKALNYPCYTPKIEKEVYGQNAVFICDPTDNSNRPVENIHVNVLKWWKFYPKTLNQAFERAFSKETIRNPTKRIRAAEWISDIFVRTRDLLIKCSCGAETFAIKEGCFFCNKPLSIPLGLEINGQKTPISKGKFIYASTITIGGDPFEEAGQCLVNKNTGQVGIKNLSSNQWATNDLGKIETIEKEEILILNKGAQITFSNDITATVI